MNKNKKYISDGVTYDLDNIWNYMKKDYWDSEDLKFDILYRLLKHQQIFNKVMKLNGLNNNNIDLNNNNAEILKLELIKKNDALKIIEPIEYDWSDEE